MGFLPRQSATSSQKASRRSPQKKTTGIDDVLAGRIRRILGPGPEITERRMFGGLAFLVNGHMCCGINGEDLMLRVGADGQADALAQPGARPMDFTGRPLRGFIYVDETGYGTPDGLASWIDRAVRFAGSLPPK